MQGSEFGIFRDWLVLALRFGLVITMNQYVHTKAFYDFMLTRVVSSVSSAFFRRCLAPSNADNLSLPSPGARLQIIAASNTAGEALNAVEELNAIYQVSYEFGDHRFES